MKLRLPIVLAAMSMAVLGAAAQVVSSPSDQAAGPPCSMVASLTSLP